MLEVAWVTWQLQSPHLTQHRNMMITFAVTTPAIYTWISTLHLETLISEPILIWTFHKLRDRVLRARITPS